MLTVLALAVVVATIHFEQRDAAYGGQERSAHYPDLNDVDRPEDLVAVRLPRAAMGYDPVAVRTVLAELGAAYSALASLCDTDTVDIALAQARGHASGSLKPSASDETTDVGEPIERGPESDADAAAGTTSSGVTIGMNDLDERGEPHHGE